MEPEDFEPRNRPAKPKDLSTLSVGDLEEYIAGLEAEIARARATIQAKQAVTAAAEAFFKR
ncbi:DUF1192 domain-containing protein [Rhodocista pekingensis]|uniref:DUF1192 domain-containing protein n=1 Tax=Rhodocista pekingensis TaxID=201185 RepID=A0ABW2KTI5_9PROT